MTRRYRRSIRTAALFLSVLLFSSCFLFEKKEAETDCVIRAEYAGDALPDHHEFTADEGEYAVPVLLTPEQPVTNFTFFALIYEGTEGEKTVFSTEELFELPGFAPEKPLLVKMTFGEVMPTYGFTYKGSDGYYKTYGITQSGKDGSLVISEVYAVLG